MTQNHWGESRLGRREHPRACTRVRNFGFEVGILVRLSLGLHAESGNETRIMLQRLSVLVQRCPDRLWRLRQQAIISQSVHLCNAGLLKHSQASILRLGSFVQVRFIAICIGDGDAIIAMASAGGRDTGRK